MGQLRLFRKKSHEEKSDALDTNDGRVDNLLGGDSGVSDFRSLYKGNGTGGIHDIYAFLQADYESRGYNDALLNPDESYRNDNAALLQQDLLILIDKTATYYEGLLKEVDFHIGSRSRAGLIDLVEELKIRKTLIADHLDKVMALRNEAVNASGATQRITLSYQRGFMRGLSALTQSKVLNKKL